MIKNRTRDARRLTEARRIGRAISMTKTRLNQKANKQLVVKEEKEQEQKQKQASQRFDNEDEERRKRRIREHDDFIQTAGLLGLLGF